MKLLERNKSTIYYKNFVSKTPVVEDEIETGEYESTYSELKTMRGYITPSKGLESEEMFGEAANYDRLILSEDTDMNEYSIVWVDRQTNEDPDFTVVRVARSLNSVTIAIRRLQ